MTGRLRRFRIYSDLYVEVIIANSFSGLALLGPLFLAIVAFTHP